MLRAYMSFGTSTSPTDPILALLYWIRQSFIFTKLHYIVLQSNLSNHMLSVFTKQGEFEGR